MPTLVIIACIVCSVAALAQWRRRCATRRFFASQYRDPNTPMPAAGGLRCLCLLAAALATGTAALLARQERATRQRAPATLCFLLDCSTSMLAAGAENTRLAEAKAAITNVLAAMPDRELCLISFAGNALLDFPPSRDRKGFLRALAAVEPSPALPAGSSPSQALQTATALLGADGSYPSPARAVLIMLSDGEINDPTPSLLELPWLSRAHPFLHLLCGLPGQDRPVPALQGTQWLQDPESGEIATSRADEQALARLAALSPLPADFLPVQAPTAQILALLRRYSDGNNNSPLGMTHRALALLALIASLAAAWPERSKQSRQPAANSHQRRDPLQPRIRLPLLLLTLLGASLARSDDIPAALRENAATRAEALAALRTAIAHGRHDDRERARLLSNSAALRILEAQEAIARGALAEAQQQAAAARELSREALRLQPGHSEALQNLAAAWRTLQQAQAPQTQENGELTEQTAQASAAGSPANDPAPSTPDTAPPDTLEAQDAAQQPGTGSPSQANESPPERLADAENHLPANAGQGSYSEEHSAGSGTWRELQLQRHYRPPRPPGTKPW